MYNLRESRASDYEELLRLHAKRGFKFPLPSKLEEVVVIEDSDTFEVAGIVATKVTRESYLWLDPDWRTPRLRWEAFKAAHEVIVATLAKLGVEEIHTSLVKGVPEGFARRMMKKLGWYKDERFMSLRIK